MNIRHFWMISLALFLTVALLGCQATEPATSAQENPVNALCRNVLPSIEEFHDAVSGAGEADPEVTVNQSVSAAKLIASAIRVSRRQEDRFTPSEKDWIEGLDLGARAYIELIDGRVHAISDSEAIAALIRIDQWFRYAADQCAGTNA